MKSSALSFPLKILVSGLFMISFSGCTSSSSVPLAPATPPPAAPGQPGEQKPDPSPTPGDGTQPTPGPGQPTPTPTPAPVKTTAARIFCMPNAGDSAYPQIASLRGDAVENYKGFNISFQLKDGTKAAGVRYPVALQSDRRQSTALVEATFSGDDTHYKIYKSVINLSSGLGTLELISSNTTVPNKFPYISDNLDIPMKFMDANQSKTAFVYPNDRGTFVLASDKGGKTSLPFSSDHYANPKFSGDAYIAFDQQISGYKIAQKFYAVKSGKTVSVGSASDSRDYQLFGFASSQGGYFWFEGRPGNGWKIKASRGSGATTVATLSGSASDIKLPGVIFERHGQVYAAYLEEQIGTNKQGGFEAKIGRMHIIKISSSFKVLDSKTVEYSDRMKRMLVPGTHDPVILGDLFFEPISGQLFASIPRKGGLASYDLDNETWNLHAILDTCLNPSWGIEETYE
jgi:hypothetical protein